MQLRNTEALASDADEGIRQLALEEQAELQGRVEDLEQELLVQLLPKDSDDERSIIVEVRAGAGGDEAALFAVDLLNMYQRCERRFQELNV